jgi:hypothetical protein
MKHVLLRELLRRTLSTPIVTSSAILQVAESTFRHLKGDGIAPCRLRRHAGYGWGGAGDAHAPEGTACSPTAQAFGLTGGAGRA